MIQVGFKLVDLTKWHAGINYYRNLFTAILTIKDRQINPLLLTGRTSSLAATISAGQMVMKCNLFDKNRIEYILDKIQTKLFDSSCLLTRYLRANHIDIVSHSDITYKTNYCKVINWIPDFQHIHLPEMCSDREIKLRDVFFNKLIEYSDILILSSVDAFNDLKLFKPEAAEKVRILNFVAQPSPEIYEHTDIKQLENKYHFSGKFFYLPNQFWKHKNHRVVFEAVQLLKLQNRNVLVLCSGLMDDYRNKDHVDSLLSYIKANGLQNNIKCLGLIPFKDLCCLLRNSISVINPSFFEGWSTTVEECKSIGKSVILSDLAVHREQAAPSAVYFPPDCSEELAQILWDRWNTSDGGPEHGLEKYASENLLLRTVSYGEAYQNIVMEAYVNR